MAVESERRTGEERRIPGAQVGGELEAAREAMAAAPSAQGQVTLIGPHKYADRFRPAIEKLTDKKLMSEYLEAVRTLGRQTTRAEASYAGSAVRTVDGSGNVTSGLRSDAKGQYGRNMRGNLSNAEGRLSALQSVMKERGITIPPDAAALEGVDKAVVAMDDRQLEQEILSTFREWQADQSNADLTERLAILYQEAKQLDRDVDIDNVFAGRDPGTRVEEPVMPIAAEPEGLAVPEPTEDDEYLRMEREGLGAAAGPFTLSWGSRGEGNQDEQFDTLEEARAAMDALDWQDADLDFATIYDPAGNEVNVDEPAAAGPVDLFGEPMPVPEPKIEQGNLLAGLAAPQGKTAEETRAFRGEKLRPEEIVGESEAVTPEGAVPVDMFAEQTSEAPAEPELKTWDGEQGNARHLTGKQEGTIPTSVLASLVGARGEQRGQHRNKQGEKWEAFKADIAERGIQDPIFITVDPGKAPQINEGNHRLDAAMELGLESVPVEIRYFGKAEDEGTVMARATREVTPPAQPLLDRVRAVKGLADVGPKGTTLRTPSVLKSLRALTPEQAQQVADDLEPTMLNGWFQPGEQLTQDEVVDLVSGAIEQHAGDDPSPARRREDLARVSAAIDRASGLADAPSLADDEANYEQETAEIPGTAARTLKPISTVELVRMVGSVIGKDKIFLKNFPNARGMFYADPNDPRVGLNPALGKDYQQFAKTLAHEIGHLIDFLSDRVMEKGNILGRIASLPGYMRSTIDALPSNPSKVLTKQDRAALRRKAEKQVGPEPKKGADHDAWAQKVTAAYGQLIREEMDARGLIGRERVHEELRVLSEWWRGPYRDSASPGYRKYRDSSVELYADALSVLLNSPGSLQERAPTFFDAWLGYLERKPDVEAAYNEIQDVLGQGPEALYAQRRADIEEDFEKGEEARLASENAEPVQSFANYLKQTFVDRAAPVIDAESRRLEDAPAASDRRTVKMAMQEYNHADNVNRLMLMDIGKDVHQPMVDAGIEVEDAGEYLMMVRIADGDRGGMAEQAKEAIMELTGEDTWAKAKAAYIELGRQEEEAREGDAFDPALLALAETGILNPKGYTPKEAKEQLAGLEKKLGEEKFAVLEESIANLREIMFRSVEEAVRVGSYNKAIFDQKILPNRDTYAPFAVVDYFNGRMPAGVRRQFGTVKGIANPYTTAILKTMSLNRLNEHQKAKQAVLAKLDADFPGQGDEQRVDKYKREKRPGPGKGNLTYLVDGKLRYREVDDFIAKVFESSDLGQLERITKTLGSKVYSIFHPLYVSWSIAWQARNIVRDWKRTYKNLASAHAGKPTYRQAIEAVAGIMNLNRAYLKSLGVAKANASRADNAVIRDMLADRALGRAFHSFEANPDANTNERLLQRYGISDPDHPGLKGKLELAGSPIEWLGVFQETLSKAAAWRVLGDMGITGRQRAYMVRNYTGTPDSQVRGLASDMVNSLWMYSNVVMAGWRSDMEVARPGSGTASGYWMRSLIADFMPKMLMASAVAGWLGDDLKEWFARIPSYDLEKYIIVPLGEMETPNGERKSVYLRLPHDDTNRVLASATWALLMGNRPYAPSHAMGIIQGEFPGVNPALDLPIKWAQALGGRNPYDSFRQRNVIPETEWTAGGWERAQEMLKYSLGQFGVVSQVMPMMPGVGEFMRPETPVRDDRVRGEQVMRTVPGLSTLIGVTDRGLDEARYWDIDAEQQARAQLRTDFSAPVRAALRERARLNQFGVANLSEPENARRRQLNQWYSRDYTRLTADMEDARDRDDDEAYQQALEQLETTLSQPSGRPTRPQRPSRPQRPQR